MATDIFVFSDESGVFDYLHNEYYIFGGLILIGKDAKDDFIRQYKNSEKAIAHHYPEDMELKASNLSPSDRAKLFRSINQIDKFGVVIKQSKI